MNPQATDPPPNRPRRTFWLTTSAVFPVQLGATAVLPRRIGSMFVLLTGLLAGCAISTPFPRGTAPAGAADDNVVLVLTRVVVNTSRRAEFDRQTKSVIASTSSHPGLLGFSARRQLFGNPGWTMTVWASDEARARFVQPGQPLRRGAGGAAGRGERSGGGAQ